MDKLEEIFRLQASFQEMIKRERGLEGIPMEKWLQMQTLAMVSELAELLEEVNFKWWKNPHALDNGNIREELCDMLHFLIGMCLEAGMNDYLAKPIDLDRLFSLIRVWLPKMERI